MSLPERHRLRPWSRSSKSEVVSWPKWLKTGAACLLLMSGIAMSMSAFNQRDPHGARAPTAVEDVVSHRAVEYNSRVVKDLKEGRMPEVLRLADQRLVSKIADGEMEFQSFKVFDSMDVDGDVVSVQVDGLRFGTVQLDKTVKDILVPVKTRGPSNVQLEAIVDGGGGVTLGFQNSSGKLQLYRLQVGETINVGVGR